MSQKGRPDPGHSLERTPPSTGLERLCRQGQLRTNFEVDVELDYEIFCFGIVHVMISTISQPARQVARPPPPHLPSAGPFCVVPSVLAMPLYAWHEFHDWCLLARAGSKLSMPAVHPQRAVSSFFASGAPSDSNPPSGPAAVRAADQCPSAAGPRSMVLWRGGMIMGFSGI